MGQFSEPKSKILLPVISTTVAAKPQSTISAALTNDFLKNITGGSTGGNIGNVTLTEVFG